LKTGFTAEGAEGTEKRQREESFLRTLFVFLRALCALCGESFLRNY